MDINNQINPNDYYTPEYKPLGAWAYFGYNILFSIPLVGLVFLIIFAVGGTSNVHLRNYARSYFCSFIIVGAILLVVVIIGLVMMLLGMSFAIPVTRF